MNAVVSLIGGPVRSVVEERAMRPPVIGKIRPGIKVLTSAARGNPDAVALYEEMVAAGDSFETIGKAIESRCRLKHALAPRNTDYFTCRRSDFNNPDVADEILRLYGENRGQGIRLYRFPCYSPSTTGCKTSRMRWQRGARAVGSTSRSTDPMVCATARRMQRSSAIRGHSVRLAISAAAT
jgi:hypothetical protein